MGHQNDWVESGERQKELHGPNWAKGTGNYGNTASRLLWEEITEGCFAPCTDRPAHLQGAALLPESGFSWLPPDLHPPELLLYDDCCPAWLPSLATLLITPVELLDQHSGTPALLEFFLFVVTPEFALDQDGSLGHLFVKCILWGHKEKQSSNKGSHTGGVSSERPGSGRQKENYFSLSFRDLYWYSS